MKVATVSATKYKHLWAVYKLLLTNTNFKNITTSVSGNIRGWRSMEYPKQTKKNIVQRDNNLFIISIENTPVCPPRYV